MAQRVFTHLYDTYDEALQTVQALEATGLPHDDISLVANNADSRHATPDPAVTGTGAKTTAAGTGMTAGTILGGGAGLLTGLGMLAIPGVGPVVAAGWLITTLAGAGVGAASGGLLGSLVGAGVPEEHAHTYAEGVRRGGSLVTVRADESQASRIESVMNSRTPAAVDVATRRADYQTEGWTGHETLASPYSAEQVAAERARRVRTL